MMRIGKWQTVSLAMSVLVMAILAPVTSVYASTTNGFIASVFRQSGQPDVIRLLSNDGLTVVRDINVTDVNTDKIASISWSPDGTELAYVLFDSNVAIYVGTVGVTGANNQIIAGVESSGVEGEDAVSWSPTGHRLAATLGSQLYFMNDDGTGVYQSALGAYMDLYDVNWVLPDMLSLGERYVGASSGDYYFIAYSPHDRYYSGSSHVDLSGSYPDSSAHSVMSPDGTSVAYLNGTDGNQITIQDSDGLNRHPLYDFGQSGFPINGLSWAPDSNKVVFTVVLYYETPDKEGNTLYTIDADGSNLTKLITASTGTGYYHPAWQPVDASILDEANTLNDFVNNDTRTHVITMLNSFGISLDSGGSSLSTYINLGAPFTSAHSWEPDALPVYRLSTGDVLNGTYANLLTANEDEAATAILQYGWSFEELAFFAYTSPGTDRMPVFRFNNTATKSRIYSADANYIATQQYSNNKNLEYEGIAFYAPINATKYNSQSVYRMTNYITGERIFTQNPEEIFYAQDRYPGWKYEGVAFKSALSTDVQSQPIYRLTNYSRKERIFTASKYEADYAVAHYKGWQYEGVAFRSYATQTPGTVPVYRLVNFTYGGRLFTKSKTEADYAVAHYKGWQYEGAGGVAFYAEP